MKCSFFQTPDFLSLPFFGLNISQSSIKITKLKKKRVGNIPTVIEEIPVSGVCDFFGGKDSQNECDELKQKILDLKKKYNIKFVQLSISEEYTYVFRIMVPNNALGMLEDFIENNIEQYIPLLASEVFFDFKVLKSSKGNKESPVVVTAISKVVVEKYSNLLESCGIFVIACEPETHAVARCVIDRNDMNPYVMININEYATNISVVEENMVQYTQTLSIKNSDVVRGMSPEVATLFKDSINKVIIYWFTSKESNIPNSKIENIILMGEDIESSNLVNFLESNLSVSATFADVWKNCFDVHEYVPSISKKDSLKYATCIGLSLFKIK